MGKNKALLPFGGAKTLLEYQFIRLTPFFESTHLSLKNVFDLPFKANIIQDTDAVYAPIMALKSVFEALDSEYVFVLPVDSPFVDSVTLFKIIECLDENVDAVIVQSPGGDHNLTGIFKRSILSKIKTMVQEERYCMGELLDKINTRRAVFESDEPFLNLNRPDDYEKALLRLEETAKEIHGTDTPG